MHVIFAVWFNAVSLTIAGVFTLFSMEDLKEHTIVVLVVRKFRK